MYHYLVLTEGSFGGTRKKLFNTLDEAVIYSMTFHGLKEVYKLDVSDCSMKKIGMDLYKDKEDHIRDYSGKLISTSNQENSDN